MTEEKPPARYKDTLIDEELEQMQKLFFACMEKIEEYRFQYAQEHLSTTTGDKLPFEIGKSCADLIYISIV